MIEPKNRSLGGTGPLNGALLWLIGLFFIWGFIISLHGILLPHLQELFSLSQGQSGLAQSSLFVAYFLFSIPAGFWVRELGYQWSLVTGLVAISIGCLVLYPAIVQLSYPLLLVSLFILIAGVVLIQVTSIPYVMLLGRSSTSAERLTLALAFHSLGVMIAPLFGASFILNSPYSSGAIELPYLLMALLALWSAWFFFKLDLPVIETRASERVFSPLALGKQSRLWLGSLAIFLCVGAEIAIGSSLKSFMARPEVAALAEPEASQYQALYWGGIMIGRFMGSIVMRKVDASRVFCFNAIAAILLLLVAMVANGKLAMYALLLVGLCNSIMLPTIFSFSLRGLGIQVHLGAGLLSVAMVGGAVVPMLHVSVETAQLPFTFVVPLLCYSYLSWFGLRQSSAQPDRF